jgi:hypothetical protein
MGDRVHVLEDFAFAELADQPLVDPIGDVVAVVASVSYEYLHIDDLAG